MKKIVSLSLIALAIPFVAHAKDFQAYCNLNFQNGNKGAVNILSKHGFSISNKTLVTQTYHVDFDNAVYYGKNRQMPLDYTSNEIKAPNAHQEFYVNVEPGKTYHFGEVGIVKEAYFAKSGKYKTEASTIIRLSNVIVDTCITYNKAEIN